MTAIREVSLLLNRSAAWTGVPAIGIRGWFATGLAMTAVAIRSRAHGRPHRP